jgi:hypothetical protein
MTTFSISFTRGFAHADWVDLVDRVEAAGDNGFNGRFHSLETDLDAISATFNEVNTAVNDLALPPTAQTGFSTITPAFAPIGSTPWSFRDGLAEKPGGAVTQATGQAAFPLPHGQRIVEFRAVGVNNSTVASLRLTLFRRQIADPSAPTEIVARLTPAGNPYSASTAPVAGTEGIDNENFTYFVIAQLSGAAATDAINVTALQVTHTTV